jgi:hypothetical protein
VAGLFSLNLRRSNAGIVPMDRCLARATFKGVQISETIGFFDDATCLLL